MLRDGLSPEAPTSPRCERQVASLRIVKRSDSYRLLRPALLSIHPLDLWSEDDGQLTFVVFGLGASAVHEHGALAVFAAHEGCSQLISARVAVIGEDGAVSRVDTLYEAPDASVASTSRSGPPTMKSRCTWETLMPSAR